MDQSLKSARDRQKADMDRARQIADEQAQKIGYTHSPGFEPSARVRNKPAVEPYKPSAPITANQGGAQDDPNIEISVGPDGEIIRRPRRK